MEVEYNIVAQRFKEQGNQAYKHQDYSKALTFYSKAIEIEQQDPSYFTNRALCYYNIDKFQDCIKDCDIALRINSDLPKAWKKKSQSYLNLLKFDEAVQAAKQNASLDKTIASRNELEEAEYLKSNYDRFLVAERENDYTQALSCITHLVNKIPNNKAIKLLRVECLSKSGQTNQANSLLNSIHNENTPNFYYLKGIIELYSGDSNKAKKHFSDGIRLDPDNVKCQRALNKAKRCEAYKQEGNGLIKQHKWKEAEAKYTQALNLEPFNKKLNSVIYSNRALTFMKRGEKIQALQDLNKSLELDPNYMKSLIRRAELNMEREDYTDALNDYCKIQQLDPSANMKPKIQQAKKKQKQARKKDYYAILGVPKTATEAQIKKAYKALALKYHPDRNRGKSDVEQEDASKKFRDINEAQGVLTDAEKRKKYDCGDIEFDGDQGASGFENMNFGGGNIGQNVKFTCNGNNMNGMGVDPSKIFQMFFSNGGGDFGGFQGFSGTQPGHGGQKSQKRGAPQSKGSNKFSNFGNFGGFGPGQGTNFKNFNFN